MVYVLVLSAVGLRCHLGFGASYVAHLLLLLAVEQLVQPPSIALLAVGLFGFGCIVVGHRIEQRGLHNGDNTLPAVRRSFTHGELRRRILNHDLADAGPTACPYLLPPAKCA
jgi:hypothetical protein